MARAVCAIASGGTDPAEARTGSRSRWSSTSGKGFHRTRSHSQPDHSRQSTILPKGCCRHTKKEGFPTSTHKMQQPLDLTQMKGLACSPHPTNLNHQVQAFFRAHAGFRTVCLPIPSWLAITPAAPGAARRRSNPAQNAPCSHAAVPSPARGGQSAQPVQRDTVS